MRGGAFDVRHKLSDDIAPRIAPRPHIRRGIETPVLQRQPVVCARLQLRQPLLQSRPCLQPRIIPPAEGQKGAALFTRLDIEGHPLRCAWFVIPVIVEGGNNAGQAATGICLVEFKNSLFVIQRDGCSQTRLLGHQVQLIGNILTEAPAGAFDPGEKR